ncbi:hypothetical protein D9V32_03105 [Mycetocola tolaasinivorans]|uniref:Abi family protein n=1 Tax=Mycetocola tolaasinivorans TaxID=76635 RepID=A0A3L7ACC0_9MICO|nr:hypothetical protein [Mycetocola tolaasinivorans]RLP77450.1 hypothetical protein D9V32_03105 [Mycetocola tolaasinivorans]
MVIFSERYFCALERAISLRRMRVYVAAARGDREAALELYLWDRRLAIGFLADIALLEPALRNAMNAQIVRRWGPEWYADPSVLLDERTRHQLSAAWVRASESKMPDDVIAHCMFGFWRGLLDRGDHVGRAPRRVRCNYDSLWRGVLDRAFPGGREQAEIDGQRWQRGYALSIVSRINALRNRVAHHEPFINGIQLPGQELVVSVETAHQDCLRLASMIDRDLRTLLLATSEVAAIIAQNPLPIAAQGGPAAAPDTTAKPPEP